MRSNDLQNPSSTKKYLAGLFLGILAVSTASIFIRFAQTEVPSSVIAAGRMSLATIVILPFAIKSWNEVKPNVNGKTWLLLILAGVFLGSHFATWITSLEYTTVASSVVFVTTAPLWVALLSPVFLKEKLTRWIAFGLIISLLGSFIVGLSNNCTISIQGVSCSDINNMWSGRYFFGNLLALAGAFLSGGYIMVGRKVRNSLSLPIYTAVVYGVASIVLILLVVITGAKVTGFSPKSYLWIIALALIPQVIGHTSFNWALKYLSAAYVSIALLGEPVGTVILAALLLHEMPTTLEILGGILILIGISVATQRIRRKKRPPL